MIPELNRLAASKWQSKSRFFLYKTELDLLTQFPLDACEYNGRIRYLTNKYTRYLSGYFLGVHVAVKSEKNISKSYGEIDRCVAYVRLTAGGSAALKEIYVDQFDLGRGKHGSYFEAPKVHGYNWTGPHPDNSFSDQDKSFNFDNFEIGDDARIFLDLALANENPSIRFLMLWSAMESQIGKGPRAKQFFQNKGCSSAQLERFSELAKLRGHLAHKGHTPVRSEDYFDLFKVFRIACLADKCGIPASEFW